MRLQTNVGTSAVLAALVALAPRLDAAGPDSSLPFPRTEARQPCKNSVATKQPFFGETHLHTAHSFDAVTIDTRNTPKDAYRYAKGEAVGLPPWADTQTVGRDVQQVRRARPFCIDASAASPEYFRCVLTWPPGGAYGARPAVFDSRPYRNR